MKVNEWGTIVSGLYKCYALMMQTDIEELNIHDFMHEDNCVGILDQLEAIKLGYVED